MVLRIDMHVHTRCSGDSWLAPATVVRIAQARGLDGIAVTDHGTIRGGLLAREANDDPAFRVIVGAEYATELGHVVGLFLTQELDIAPPGGQKPALAEVVRAIRAQGGIAVLAHPFQVHRDLAGRAFAADVRPDAVETFNARASAARFPQANAWAAEFARRRGIPALGASDAHLAREIGCGLTWFETLGPDVSDDELKRAILSGDGTPLGSASPPIVIPLSQVARMWNRREFGRAPKIAARLLLTALGPLGLQLATALRGPRQDGPEADAD